MARVMLATDIDAAPADVVGALDTQAGLAGWWCDDVVLDTAEGSGISLGLPSIAPGRLLLRVDSATVESVHWTVIGDIPRAWMNTFIVWTMGTQARNVTTLHLLHGGWVSDEGQFATDAYIWARLIDALNRYLHTGTSDPVFTHDSHDRRP
jgi:hypothetical protein